MTLEKLRNFICKVPYEGLSNYLSHGMEMWVDGIFTKYTVTLRCERVPDDQNRRVITFSPVGMVRESKTGQFSDGFVRLTIGVSELLNPDLFDLTNARVKVYTCETNVHTNFEDNTEMPFSCFCKAIEDALAL